MIYEPREDSYLLAQQVKKFAKGKVLDIGTGSGIQAETATKNGADVLAVDIDKECVNNALKKGLNAKISDLFSNVKGKFDFIIFNPPYLPEEESEDFESKRITTGGKKGHEIIAKFLKQAKNHLKKSGKILLVCSSLTGDVEKIILESDYCFKLLSEKKMFFETLKVYLIKRA